MASRLKDLHPYLYKRVQTKGWLFTILGLNSIFSQYVDHLLHTDRSIQSQTGNIVTGVIFLGIGVAILASLFRSINYYASRKFLYVAFVYAMFFEVLLAYFAVTKTLSTVGIFIVWGYLCRNLWLISRDSAWGGAAIIEDLRDNGKI